LAMISKEACWTCSAEGLHCDVAGIRHGNEVPSVNWTNSGSIL
jgi:hypothetical protein